MNWTAEQEGCGDVNIFPRNDLVHHNDGLDCICGPSVEEVGSMAGDIRRLFVHHSLDGREQHESAYE